VVRLFADPELWGQAHHCAASYKEVDDHAKSLQRASADSQIIDAIDRDATRAQRNWREQI